MEVLHKIEFEIREPYGFINESSFVILGVSKSITHIE